MDKVKAFFNDKGVQVAALTGTLLSMATLAHAQTPIYTMDATVSSSVQDLLASLVQTVFDNIPIALGLVGGLVATLFGIRWLIGFARGNMHG